LFTYITVYLFYLIIFLVNSTSFYKNNQRDYNKFLYNLTLDIIKCDDVSDENIKKICDASVGCHKELYMDAVTYYFSSLHLTYLHKNFIIGLLISRDSKITNKTEH